MAAKPLHLTAEIVADQTSVTLGQGNRDKNRITIALANTSDEPVTFGGFGQNGTFTLSFTIGSGAQDLVRTLAESVKLEIDAPQGWQAEKYKKIDNRAVYAFDLPETVFGPKERKTVTVKAFECCTDPGQAHLQLALAISGYEAFAAAVDVAKKAAAFELLFFEADPSYITTEDEKQAFTLAWSTIKAGRVVLTKNGRDPITFTAGGDEGFENGKKFTYTKDHPDLAATDYELTAYDETGTQPPKSVKQTVYVLQPGWHEVEFRRQYGYPAVLCNLDDVNLYGIFIKNGQACLCSSKHPYAVWNLETDAVPQDMGTSPGVGFKSRLWLVGGSSVAPETCSNRMYAYDAQTAQWQAQTAGWTARMGHACVVFNQRLWVMGGLDGNGNPLQDVHSMDAQGSWQRHADAPWAPRCMAAVAVYRNRLWIYGGCAEPFGDARTDMWTSADGEHWDQYEILPHPKDGALGEPISNDLQVIDNELYLLGSFRSGYLLKARNFRLNRAQRIWIEIDGDNPWDQQGDNTFSLSGVTFNDLLFLRSLNYQTEDNPTKLYLYKKF